MNHSSRISTGIPRVSRVVEILMSKVKLVSIYEFHGFLGSLNTCLFLYSFPFLFHCVLDITFLHGLLTALRSSAHICV